MSAADLIALIQSLTEPLPTLDEMVAAEIKAYLEELTA